MNLSKASVKLPDNGRLDLSLCHLDSLVSDLVAEVLELSHDHLSER
jgi:hypothetical protein